MSDLPGADTAGNTAQRRRRILIVDDDPVILKAQSMKLESEGYEVTCAVDSSSAIASVRDEKPDAVLLDVVFPPEFGIAGLSDGLQIMSWLKRLGATAGVPFIIITGTRLPGQRELAMSEGAAGYFEKPIDQAALLKLLRETLSNG